MSEKKNAPYLDVVANAFKTAQAWRTTTFVVSALAAFLAFALVYQARNTPVVLVPYDLAANTERMTVTTNGEIRGTSFEYMANVGLADLSLILNFTPDNVLTQHKRFLNRMTDELYGQQNTALLAAADDLKRKGITQSFFPTEVRLAPGSGRVEVEGTQIRYQGGKELVRTPVTYIITYKAFKGYLHVADLRQKSDVVKTDVK